MAPTTEYERCGIGIRGVAIVIDSLVWFALTFASVAAVGLATGQLQRTGGEVTTSLEGAPAAAAVALWLGLVLGYHAVGESRFGATVGKYLVGIRVRSDDGTRASLGATLVRNLVRPIDWVPGGYGLGLVSMLLSDETKRLGDRVARTIVVRS